MKLSVLSIGLLACLTPLTAAWTKEDREIFRVRDELAAAEGPGVTFYDFLGVPPSASMDDINKAYRKKSRALHPDKVKSNLAAERAKAKKAAAAAAGGGKKKKAGVTVAKAPTQAEVRAAIKRASEQQARLSIVANVLRGPGRDTYDHFLRSGFPVWKGTGYYYNRYRPGLGTVMFGLFLFVGGGAHYLALYMGWKRQREFVERYIRFARHAAWGDNLGANIPGIGEAAAAPAPPPPPQQQAYADEDGRPVALNRKQRRMQEREDKREAKSSNGGRKGRRGAPGSGAGSGTATPTQQALQGAGPTGAKKRVVAENGKILVVDSLGDVYLEQEDEDGNVGEFLLDNANMINHHAQPNELARPTIRDTALVRLPVWAYGATVGRVLGRKRAAEDDEELEEEVDDDSSEPGKAVATPSTDSAAEDFEMLDRSTDSLGQAKTTGSQAQGGRSKGNKRKGKKK